VIIKAGIHILANGDQIVRTGNQFTLTRKTDERLIKRLSRLTREQLLALASLPCYRPNNTKDLLKCSKEELIAGIALRPAAQFHLSWVNSSQDPDALRLFEMIKVKDY